MGFKLAKRDGELEALTKALTRLTVAAGLNAEYAGTQENNARAQVMAKRAKGRIREFNESTFLSNCAQ